MNSNPNATYWNFNCPAGGKWYACPSDSASKFVGCCTSDPCGSNSCSQGNLRPGAFNASHYGEFKDASCGSGSTFQTCTYGGIFWGCCKTSACAKTVPSCDASDLAGAYLSSPVEFANYINSSSSASQSPTPTPSDADNTPPSSNSSSNNTAAIVGGVVGGVVVLAIIGALLFFCLRKKKHYQKSSSEEPDATAMTSTKKGNERYSSQYGNLSPPPTYSSPHTDYHQTMSATKPFHHQYANIGDAPQELPTELPSASGSRYSELPAGAMNPHRYSELPAGAGRASELESPQPSPRPMQTEFSADMAKQKAQNIGLGVVIEDSQRNK